MEKDAPYKPRYKGFDEEATRNAQETARRSAELQAGRGEDTNAEYVDEGPREYAERTGGDAESLGKAVERARTGRQPTQPTDPRRRSPRPTDTQTHGHADD